MNKIFIGKIINTHGIKGELKIRSDFKYKDEVFVNNMKIYIEEEEHIIHSSRNQMEYKLILIDDYNNINDVLKYKNKNIYIDRKLINEKYILNEDIIGYNVIVGDKNIGKLTNVIQNGIQEILVINSIMIPYVDAFVIKIDTQKREIYINEIEGLIE